MSGLRALLMDRRRRQRGSVLSGVLIIVAFLSIISGALMTELSTNFLLSNNLVNRVKTEATVNSSVELALNQLQNTPINAPCPSLPPVTLNGQTASVSYASCAPVVDRRSPQFVRVTTTSPFTVDGSHAQLSGLNNYVVGDSGGTVLDYTFGSATPRWTLALGGSVTGTPLVMPDPLNAGQFLDLVPVSGPACAPTSSCVSVRTDLSSGSTSPPALQCTTHTAGLVVSQPAVGRNNTDVAYFGDSSGAMYAIDPTSGGGNCEAEGNLAAGNPVVAAPVVFPCQQSCAVKQDEVYVLTSGGGSSHLLLLTYSLKNGLAQVGSLSLPWANPSGIAVESAGLPSRVAISFAGGQVAVVQLDSDSDMSLAASVTLPAAVNGPPYWCHCPGSVNLIGIGAGNGSLYVRDTSLNSYATYSGGSAINTAPAADAAGNWYFAADDGRLYEVQKPAGGTTMALAAIFGKATGSIGSSPVLATCPAGICVYLGSLDASAYLISLNARDAVLTACVSVSPPTCSGANPRLWASAEVGAAGSPQTVHIEGWSYYSP